jgi:hypothetical protein
MPHSWSTQHTSINIKTYQTAGQRLRILLQTIFDVKLEQLAAAAGAARKKGKGGGERRVKRACRT